MDLKRKGRNRDSGFHTAFENRSARLSFDPTLGFVHFNVVGADGMGAQGEYEYSVSLSSNDLAALIEFLSQQQSLIENGPLNAQLRLQSHSLLRLLIASSGLPYALQPTEFAIKLAKLRAVKKDKDSAK
jgi:hypothetical protein